MKDNEDKVGLWKCTFPRERDVYSQIHLVRSREKKKKLRTQNWTVLMRLLDMPSSPLFARESADHFYVFLPVQFRQRQESCALTVKSWERKRKRERERGKERKAPEVSAGILMASIMHTIIGSNWGAIILHLQSNVSLNMKACADVSAFLSFCLLCVCYAYSAESPPGSREHDFFNTVSLNSADTR